MQLKELKLLSNLIHSCGVEELNRIIDSNVQLVNYIKDSKKEMLYTESKNKQIFTNSESSIFYLNEKMIDYELIKAESKFRETNFEEINNYLFKSKELFGKQNSKVMMVNYAGMIISSNAAIEAISIIDSKLLQLLLGDSKIYASKENPVIYAESDKGYAYVLGRKEKNRLKF